MLNNITALIFKNIIINKIDDIEIICTSIFKYIELKNNNIKTKKKHIKKLLNSQKSNSILNSQKSNSILNNKLKNRLNLTKYHQIPVSVS